MILLNDLICGYFLSKNIFHESCPLNGERIPVMLRKKAGSSSQPSVFWPNVTEIVLTAYLLIAM